MSLRLVTTRPYRFEDDIADIQNRVHIELLSKHEVRDEIHTALDKGSTNFPGVDYDIMCSHLYRRDEQNLGNGDLFEAHQIEPLAAILYALGVTRVRTQTDVDLLITREKEWYNVSDKYKLFEMFGTAILPRTMTLIEHLVGQHWNFQVLDNEEQILNTPDAEFFGRLTNKEQTA